MSRIYECMSLHEKKGMKLQMRVSLLINWLYDKEIILHYQVKPNIIISFLQSERGRKKKIRKNAVIMEAESERCYVASFEMEEGDYESRNVDSL